MKTIISFLISLLYAGIYFIRWRTWPQEVPVHYNLGGEITRIGSKNELITLGIVPLFFSFLFVLIGLLYKKIKGKKVSDEQREKDLNILAIVGVATVAFEILNNEVFVYGRLQEYIEGDAELITPSSTFFSTYFVCCMVSLISLVLGLVLFKKTPRRINSFFGYRSKRSMLNEQTWEFGNKYCGKLMILFGMVSFVVSVSILLLPIVESDNLNKLCCGFLGIQVAVGLIIIFFVEKALKKKFDI